MMRRIERAIGIQHLSKAQPQQSVVLSLIKALVDGVLQSSKTLDVDGLPALYMVSDREFSLRANLLEC